MSAIRTFTVTVQSTAGGNKYFIDGVQQATVTLAEGYTDGTVRIPIESPSP